MIRISSSQLKDCVARGNRIIDLGIFPPYVLSADYKAEKRREQASRWFVSSYREKAQERGVYAVARQLRKQGVPLDVAVAVLATR